MKTSLSPIKYTTLNKSNQAFTKDSTAKYFGTRKSMFRPFPNKTIQKCTEFPQTANQTAQEPKTSTTSVLKQHPS